MNNTTSHQQQQTERLQALLTLAAQPTHPHSDCPDDQQLADFIQGDLQGEARNYLLQHLQDCPTCYQQWQFSVECLSFAPSAKKTVSPALLTRYWQRLSQWWQTHTELAWLGTGTATAALLGLWFSLALLPQMLAGPGLNQQLDVLYQALRNEHKTAVQHAVNQFAPPPNAAAQTLGFMATLEPLPSQQAFTAGIKQGRQTLIPSLSAAAPASASEWVNSDWHTYYALGRWSFALWTVSQFQYELTANYWAEQSDFLQQLQVQLAALPSNDATLSLLSRLNTIAALLKQLPAPEQPHLYEQLGRELNLLIQTFSIGT